MKVVALMDIHGELSCLGGLSAELAEADVVLLAGDITHFGREGEAQQVVDSIRQMNSRILAVSGNCDYPDVEDYLRREGLSIHRRSVVLDGVGFVGVGGSLTCPGRTPNEVSEDDFEQYLAEAVSELPPGIPMILVAHQPPFETVNDVTNIGKHVGSRSVRGFIERHQPLICFTGHIHEGIGVDAIGETKIVNPGPFRNGQYAYAKLGDRVEELDIRRLWHPES
jgi:Icc-related predicted phosphoesterase